MQYAPFAAHEFRCTLRKSDGCKNFEKKGKKQAKKLDVIKYKYKQKRSYGKKYQYVICFQSKKIKKNLTIAFKH